ncbi:uncharacterized protein LOC127283730 isoform X3 [Leptopilina boulardi]|uniref:uncharacterized protein LOC127283730 isoform X1 n=1 Tax=Leptopilina boulardi TaxID=63433 RepID=UPI0021F62118|nr:uncharacterized protein LOC127283730 isoform X1 [Leptopilina boulardi]XP_051164743.1 uncharacterized protein LOC127283730 isoform X2 [Leptopilina boulardi]XP_051164744.1 uncharacterized protein LOC127283730 isoform X3 [Leptopilina boulardi]
MFLNQSTKTSRSFGIFSIPYFLLMIFLIKECSSRLICHSSSNLEAGQKYEISHTGFQEKDFDDSSCIWDLNTSDDKRLQLNCTVKLSSATCDTQAVELYTNFKETQSNPDQYCETTSFITTSLGPSTRIVSRSQFKTSRGNFTCNIEVVPVPVLVPTFDSQYWQYNV